MDINKKIKQCEGEIRAIDQQVITLKERKKALNLLIRKLTTVGNKAEEIIGSTLDEEAHEELKEATIEK